MTNKSRMLYTGMTNDLYRRVTEHQEKKIQGFTSKYNINQLVYYEEYSDAFSAIEREKQIKGWLRSKKIALIEEYNPDWLDLSVEWVEEAKVFYLYKVTHRRKSHFWHTSCRNDLAEMHYRLYTF